MLEGAVARLLNDLLGKYVIDLDTENLNIGIFSGHVQLTDLKLKSEALYELNLPIEVKAGTIGKIWIQIPWKSLWSQPITVNIEDLHIICGPIINTDNFDEEKNKRLLRASKRKLLEAVLNSENNLLMMKPLLDRLLTNILNNVQYNINNIHIRYEDSYSYHRNLSAGLCIGSIIAEITNNKWKTSKFDKNLNTCYYLIKMESLSIYWNDNVDLIDWKLPSEYYNWRNAMSNSLKNYKINNENFEFLLRPMTVKIKITIQKTPLDDTIEKCSLEFIMQDINMQLNKGQYNSILSVLDAFNRMWISWKFLNFRPKTKILEKPSEWWKYALQAVIQQRIKPYCWSNIRFARHQYRNYLKIYKEIMLNPNDTELKLDLFKYKDNLNIINMIIARQQAKLLLKESGQYYMQQQQQKKSNSPIEKQFTLADYKLQYEFKIQSSSVVLTLFDQTNKEILSATMIQTNLEYHPNINKDIYKILLKIEGIIVDGQSQTCLLSHHLPNSPAYFFKFELEKFEKNSAIPFRVNFFMDTVECLYDEKTFNQLNTFFTNNHLNNIFSYNVMIKYFENFYQIIHSKLRQNWNFTINFKFPIFILQLNENQKNHILLIDLGRYIITTEISNLMENATKMELEEQLYTKLNFQINDIQILFCTDEDDWKDACKEKDTEIHLLSKTNFSAMYAIADQNKIKPGYKFNVNFPILKINLSERSVVQLIKLLPLQINNNKEIVKVETNFFINDRIIEKLTINNLIKIRDNVTLNTSHLNAKRPLKRKINQDSRKSISRPNLDKNLKEVWARNVDLPGLEDNISPSNNIIILFRLIIEEFSLIFSRSSDCTNYKYLMLRLGNFTSDIALMDYGPACQISLNNVLLTDKMNTNSSGQYIDLFYSSVPNNLDALTILYRKVSASCPDFWTHFHGVETSLVVDVGNINFLLHQEAIHTAIKYFKYMYNKISSNTPSYFKEKLWKTYNFVGNILQGNVKPTPVPSGSVKFSHSGRLSQTNIRICDSDFDIINIQLTGLEMDFLFRANERFIFKSFLSGLNIDYLSDITLYNKVVTTDEDKVFEMKYVRHDPNAKYYNCDIDPNSNDIGGSFRFNLGQIHITFLYKLIVQLQRFLINLEALDYIYKTIIWLSEELSVATDSFKSNEKIYLSINVCGPILLLPQKSSSPNALIINTGKLHMENFFKDYNNTTTDVIENILVKLKNFTINRGVITLSSTLELQETLIEPINLNLDIKRCTIQKMSNNKSWEIDGIVDPIQITFGQRDISTILSIYIDNIGEGQILDLFPINETVSPLIVDEDSTVKNLEAFFCEPKQKIIIGKLCLEEITLSIFFDSGELLSSPIRDLNHGLCKLIINEINTNFTIYNDGNLDGKLSVDKILIEEIGPDANIYDKGILQSPSDDTKNNNCNITINKPPIIDIMFHQNKSNDRTIDIIIGRLSLNLSVLFCEKFALFILECTPRDNQDIYGCINHGYEGDIVDPSDIIYSSLTISLRINKPELNFLVETTSNKKRYFKTNAEILIDYSRHNNQLNWVVNLSGLNTIFYDWNLNAPYMILKKCDIELSKSVSDEKGTKIITSISSIFIQICCNVVQSLTDIFNEILEHFNVSDLDLARKQSAIITGKKNDVEDLWEVKKTSEFHQTNELKIEENNIEEKKRHEIFLIPKFEMIVIFELETIQVILIKSTMETTIYNWSSFLNCTCELTLQANYFNESLQVWEPFLDPVVIEENQYKPWDILIKIFQDKSMPMLDTNNETKGKKNFNKNTEKKSTTTSEDEESTDDMLYMKPLNLKGNNRRLQTSLSTFLEDTDSESEDGTMDKLASAISDLFTGDWNESEDSDYVRSSDDEEESEDNSKANEQLKSKNFSKTIYFLIETKEILNLTITPNLLKLLNEMLTVYSNKTISIINNGKHIDLINDIGPKTKVELLKKGKNEEEKIIYEKTFENQDLSPNSPVKFNSFYSEDDDIDEILSQYCNIDSKDSETVSNLMFPIPNTTDLYEKINQHFIRIFVSNLLPIQTSCMNRNWEKLLKLQSKNLKDTYYIAAKHSIGKCGRKVIISSPLLIKNETCFALSVLYQPFVLQQLNLEPVGDMRNPFETTMRITVLEAYEEYNVPLYISYHCKLFIQPAYAEGHYICDNGIWWKDLATELDVAHNFYCRPKPESNLEIFSLRVILKRNLQTINRISNLHSIPNYVIHLIPPLILYNFLPYSLEVENLSLKQLVKIEPSEKKSVYSMDLDKDQKLMIRVKFNGIIWTGIFNFTTHLEEKIINLNNDNKDTITTTTTYLKNLSINIKVDREGSCNVFFYVPYWIINKTGLPLQIKVSDTNILYKCNSDDILLFSYKRHGKQSLNIRIYESNWSNEFSLDSPGTTGLVVCKDNERKKKYFFFLNIKLSQMCSQFTKLITILPGFLITNTTNKNLRYMENNEKTDLWVDLAPQKTLVFWPETNSMQMFVKYKDSKLNSQAFSINSHHKTVLRMDKGGALTVEVTGGISESFQITFKRFQSGDAPILIENYCADLFLKIQQSSQNPVTLLGPYQSLLYTWDDPTKNRELTWNVYNNKNKGFIINLKDSYGEEKIAFHIVSQDSSSEEDSDSVDNETNLLEKVRRDKVVIYWLCYRDGPQRILFFTQDQKIFDQMLKKYFLEHCEFEILVSLKGLGFSIFTPKNSYKEHFYLSISDSPPIWEVNVGEKWKTLTLELASWIEEKYKLQSKKCQLKDYVHIDFEKMFMLKPFFAELRRTYYSACYFHWRKSKNYQNFNLKLQHFQIDNKITNNITLQPLPLYNIKGSNAFIDLNIAKTTTKNVSIYRSIRLAIRNFSLNIENNLLIELSELLKSYKIFKLNSSTAYVMDMKILQDINTTKYIIDNISGTNTFIENLLISPFEIHLNIYNKMTNEINSTNNYYIKKIINYLFPSNITSYVPMEGTILKIGGLQYANINKSLMEIIILTTNQLSSQFLQQYYTHILGLQVLVNAFALKLSQNQYDQLLLPIDCEKISNILLYGFRCLLSHINMSPAAQEQSVIDIFPHQSIESIQRIRRHGNSYQTINTNPKILLISSKNFSSGVPNALNQLILRQTHNTSDPYSNNNNNINNHNHNNNAEIFFKTTGKALFSIMVRHSDEKSNSVEIAKEAIKRAAILGEPIKIHQRLIRYCNNYIGLRPYSVYESMGHYLLETVGNCRFINDHYWSHAAIDKIGKSIILISLEHVIKISKSRLWGPWEIEWVIDLDDIISMPKITTNELLFNIRQSENQCEESLKLNGDKEILFWIYSKIEQAIVVSMEIKSWPVTNYNN